MAERIVVDEAGIWTDGANGAIGFPWPEIMHVSVCALTVPPDDQQFLYLDVSHVSGEFLELGETMDGFPEAARAVAARSGRDVPDLGGLQPPDGGIELYRARTVGG